MKRNRRVVAGLLATAVVVVVSFDAGDGPIAYADVAVESSDLLIASVMSDDPVGTVDPGYDRDVASCTTGVNGRDVATVEIRNAYPSYTCTFQVTIRNAARYSLMRAPIMIEAPDDLEVWAHDDRPIAVIDPESDDVETFSVHLLQSARQDATYRFSIAKPFRLLDDAHGSPGFWKNWDSHNLFEQAWIESALGMIDDASDWLGPREVEGMVVVMGGGTVKPTSDEDKFLRQYLAARLGERMGFLDLDDTYDVSRIDDDNYLGLANPATATFAQVIEAIEAKAADNPTKQQFNVMKDICESFISR